MTHTLFISDLHLDPDRPEITALFLQFLKTQAGKASALYILGDLFEAWVGDDDTSPDNLAICKGIRECTTTGTPVFIMHGNRDFLLGTRFSEDCHCILLPDPTLIDLHGTRTLLMHGDLLCTDDTEYMSFRKMVRNPDWQAALLAKPLEQRQSLAAEMRQTSRDQTSGKPEAIMDVNQQAVSDILRKHKAQLLIHGHTHRPAIHTLDVAGTPARRIVLGDWYQQGSVLECSASGCDLQTLSVN